ncbi:MAG: tetratricopeptide repeat protein, partial [Planctomycetota bacterium]
AMELLAEIADDEFEDVRVQQMATFALAFYGDRTRVEKSLESLKKLAEQGSEAQKLGAWGGLATLHYQIRDYKKAVISYQKLIELGPSEEQLPTHLYNLACSQSLSGDIDGAFGSLDRALGEAGSSRLSDTLLRTDHDIQALRKDERFRKILLKHGRKWAEGVKKAASRSKAGK